MTVHVTAKDSLHGYHAWRDSLEALPVGTVIQWVEAYNGISLSSSVKAAQSYKILAVRPPMIGNSTKVADQVYDMVLVSRNGREYKRKMGWSVESIARGLYEGKLMQIIKEAK